MDKNDLAKLLLPLNLKSGMPLDEAIDLSHKQAEREEAYEQAKAVPNQLTPNFTLAEFKTKFNGAGPWNVFVNLDAQRAAQILQKARDQFKFSVTILSFSKTSSSIIVEVNSGNNTQLNTILNGMKVSNTLGTKSVTITLPL